MQVNTHLQQMKDGYLFTEIINRTKAYQTAHPVPDSVLPEKDTCVFPLFPVEKTVSKHSKKCKLLHN